MDRSHSKCECIDGSILNKFREPIHYSGTLDKPGLTNFCEPEAIE